MSAKNNLSGYRYGSLEVTETSKATEHGYEWLCICDCGVSKFILAKALRSGATKSCGCKRRLSRGGVSNHRLATTHSNMMARCYNPANENYCNYGARGILVCERWKSLRNFVEDLEATLLEGLTLDRVDLNGPYSPENCRVATRKEQQRNRRCTLKATISGVTKSVSEWAEESGVKASTLKYRLAAGWPEDKLLCKAKT